MPSIKLHIAQWLFNVYVLTHFTQNTRSLATITLQWLCWLQYSCGTVVPWWCGVLRVTGRTGVARPSIGDTQQPTLLLSVLRSQPASQPSQPHSSRLLSLAKHKHKYVSWICMLHPCFIYLCLWLLNVCTVRILIIISTLSLSLSILLLYPLSLLTKELIMPNSRKYCDILIWFLCSRRYRNEAN